MGSVRKIILVQGALFGGPFFWGGGKGEEFYKAGEFFLMRFFPEVCLVLSKRKFVKCFGLVGVKHFEVVP